MLRELRTRCRCISRISVYLTGYQVIINALSLFWVTGGSPKSTKSVSSATRHTCDSLRTGGQPIQSILKPSPLISASIPIPEAFSPSSSEYISGPHRIESAYYQCKGVVSCSPSSTTTPTSIGRSEPHYPQDPRYQEFPMCLESDIRIGADPDIQRGHAIRCLRSPVTKEADEIQVRYPFHHFSVI